MVGIALVSCFSWRFFKVVDHVSEIQFQSGDTYVKLELGFVSILDYTLFPTKVHFRNL